VTLEGAPDAERGVAGMVIFQTEIGMLWKCQGRECEVEGGFQSGGGDGEWPAMESILIKIIIGQRGTLCGKSYM